VGLVLAPDLGASSWSKHDAVADLVASLSAAIDAANPAQLRELVRLLVERVTTREGAVATVEVRPAARPFFPVSDLVMAPPDGIEPPTPALGRLRSIH
jgi:hypothetical protein